MKRATKQRRSAPLKRVSQFIASEEKPVSKSRFFVAGLGASAGGLEALGSFFDAMPPDSGLAFVVIQHLSPNHKSMMAELLARNTRMPVRQAEDGMTALANHVYLIPPKKCLTIFNGKLLITEWNGDRVPTCRSTLSFAHSPRIAASGRSPSRFPARAAMGRAAFGRSRRRAGW